jgi:hypothetical protein
MELFASLGVPVLVFAFPNQFAPRKNVDIKRKSWYIEL